MQSIDGQLTWVLQHSFSLKITQTEWGFGEDHSIDFSQLFERLLIQFGGRRQLELNPTILVTDECPI